VQSSHTSGQHIDMLAPDELHAAANVIARYLQRIGYRVHLSVVADDTVYFAKVSDPSTRPHVHLARWSADLLTASNFAALAGCDARGPSGLNATEFCDAQSERLIIRALTVQEYEPAEVAASWRAVDHRLSDLLAWVPLASEQGAIFVGSKVNTIVEMPMMGPAFERIAFASP